MKAVIENNNNLINAEINGSNSTTAVVGTTSGDSLKVKIKRIDSAYAETITLGEVKRLTDLLDIDFTALEQGAVLIYDDTLKIWRAKADMDDGTRIECGHY